jgi:hypothetical protein
MYIILDTLCIIISYSKCGSFAPSFTVKLASMQCYAIVFTFFIDTGLLSGRWSKYAGLITGFSDLTKSRY